MCQPSSLTRLDSGSSISGVVAPAWARLKRMPRTPSPCIRLSSSVDILSLTTATMRAEGPNAASDSRCSRLGRRLHQHVAGGADALLEGAIIIDQGVGRAQRRRGVGRKPCIIDVMVAV